MCQLRVVVCMLPIGIVPLIFVLLAEGWLDSAFRVQLFAELKKMCKSTKKINK